MDVITHPNYPSWIQRGYWGTTVTQLSVWLQISLLPGTTGNNVPILTDIKNLISRRTKNWMHLLEVDVLEWKYLIFWGRVTHICYSTIAPVRRQATIWTIAGILLIWHLGTYFSGIVIEINTFSFNGLNIRVTHKKTTTEGEYCEYIFSMSS